SGCERRLVRRRGGKGRQRPASFLREAAKPIVFRHLGVEGPRTLLTTVQHDLTSVSPADMTTAPTRKGSEWRRLVECLRRTLPSALVLPRPDTMHSDATGPAIELLRTLSLFARHGEVGRTARAIGLSASVVSRRLGELQERPLELIEKRGPTPTLTPKGAAALASVNRLL